MTDPPSEPAAVAVALAELRGEVREGFATVNGRLAMLAQRDDQTDRRLADHEQRLDSLERARWPLPSLAALVGAIGLGLTLWQLARGS
ncbi:hypothetical protein ACFV5N_02000 [Streptomyces sp. NPDC059853]|uniref:hypothetical protein n=1 Tax=Streptomyces sp. NPDC059853 TaxID=3346973 RepID=UPI003654F2CF